MAVGLAQRLFEERYGSGDCKAKQWPLLAALVTEERLSSLSIPFARHLGAEEEGEALFLAFLLKSAQDGHLCVSVRESLAPDPHVGWLIGFDEAERVCELLSAGANERRGVIQRGGRYYLERLFAAEERVVTALDHLLPVKPMIEATGSIAEDLGPEQKDAVLCAAGHSVSMIVGGPGTGKTYTARRLIEALGEQRVALAAPTGKAAGNLQRALGGRWKVQTLHALLGLPRRPVRQLAADLIVVDEAAMIDVKLLGHLLTAVKPGSRLVLMGDPAQLPPVEAGGLFGELTEHPALQGRVARLTRCVRTDKLELLELAAAVKGGDVDQVLNGVDRLPWGEAEELVAASRQGHRILTAHRQGPWGSEALNQRIVAVTNSAERPIVITRNDYRLGLFNGDEGVVANQVARFGEREFSVHALPPYEHAYCLSVHKSQGSEFDSVVLVAPPGSEIFGRELLYTALTRAKRHFAVCAPDEVLAAMVSRHSARHSGVATFDFKQ